MKKAKIDQDCEEYYIDVVSRKTFEHRMLAKIIYDYLCGDKTFTKKQLIKYLLKEIWGKYDIPKFKMVGYCSNS